MRPNDGRPVIQWFALTRDSSQERPAINAQCCICRFINSTGSRWRAPERCWRCWVLHSSTWRCNTLGQCNSSITPYDEAGSEQSSELEFPTRGPAGLRMNWKGTPTATIAEATINSKASPFPRKSQAEPIASPTASELMKAAQARTDFLVLNTVRSLEAQRQGCGQAPFSVLRRAQGIEAFEDQLSPTWIRLTTWSRLRRTSSGGQLYKGSRTCRFNVLAHPQRRGR
jgi:hypothetical protein